MAEQDSTLHETEPRKRRSRLALRANDRLVCVSSEMLQILLQEEVNKNELISRLTSMAKSDRTYVFKVIDSVLIKNELVKAKKNPDRHKQRQVLRLTDMGKDIALLIRGIKRFDSSYSELRSKIQTHYVPLLDHPNDKGLLAHLNSKGWNKNQAEYYFDWVGIVTFVQTESPQLFINSLLGRYFFIQRSHTLSQVVRSILAKLISDSINRQLLTGFVIDAYPTTRTTSPKNWSPLLDRLRLQLIDFENHISFESGKLFQVSEEIGNIMNSLLGLINPNSPGFEDVMNYLLPTEENSKNARVRL